MSDARIGTDNGWIEYRNLVIDRLERLDETTSELSKAVAALNTRLALIDQRATARAAIVSAIVTSIGAVAVAVLSWLRS